VLGAEAEISSWIAESARRSPGKLAIRFDGDEITYAQLERRVARLAGALAEREAIGEGDRVAYLGQNAPELLDLLFACARIGAILVPLSARMPAPELEVVLGNTEPKLLLAEAEFARTASEAGASLELRVIAFGDDAGTASGGAADTASGGAAGTVADTASGTASASASGLAALLDGAPELPSDPDRPLDTPLLVINTSGTTGPPKGAVLTHENLHFNALNVAAAVGINSADEVLANGPLFNTGPMNILTTPAFAAGATVTILRQFDPGASLEAIERHAVTLSIATPAMTKALIAHPRWDATDLSSLRHVITGSTTVREEVLAPWFERGVRVLQDYGLTEAMPVVTIVPADDAHRLRDTAGKPVPHCRVRIAADDGSPVAAGEEGEVLVQGPTVMREYWRYPEATAETFHDDRWLRTGDIGRIDDDGVLRIVGRLKNVIIVGSCNVFPADVEAVLVDCPQIAEAAVLGRPDDELGEVVVAFVALERPGALSADEVKALFDGRLAAYKHPRDVVFVDALPRNVMGKVDAGALRDSLAA
jgi:fatty-acyl-CoA synthase